MALESRLELRLTQKLVLTPQLQQAIKLLQMPHLELSQFLSQELMENPFLEESADEVSADELTPEEKESLEVEEQSADEEVPLDKLTNFAVDEYFEDRISDGRDMGYFNPGTVTPPSFDQFLSKKPDLYDHLLWQLRLSHASEQIKRIGEIIIGNIDENGYLVASLEEISEAGAARLAEVEEALMVIQTFDPPGVGARDVAECLLLQINGLQLQGTIVENIIRNNMGELEKKKYSAIAQQHGIALNDVLAAVRVIEGLEPKPGRNFSSDNTNYVAPDVYLIKTAEGYQIILNDDGVPKLRVSSFYKNLLQQNSGFPREDKQFLVEKMRSAVGLLKSLDQRNRTIYRVTETLLDLQKDFFEGGVQHLKPLTLKEVASTLNLHESTVSRVTSNKYLACEHGVFGFRYLFSSALSSGMGSVSSTSVKDTIRKILSEEAARKPLSDQHVAEILKREGIVIARRTVAKYREELGIPSQIQRRKSAH
jgi:RNA polymerase sigma-54 factor